MGVETRGDGYDYVRHHYGVEVEVGQRVIVDGRSGTLVQPTYGDQYLHVRFDGSQQVLPCHPTWRVEYPVWGRSGGSC